MEKFGHRYCLEKFTFLSVKVSSLLIFYHFFQNWILKVIWRFHTKKEVMCLLFNMSSSLVIISFHNNAWPHVARMDNTAEAHWLEIWDFSTFAIFFWSFTHWLPFFSSIWTLFYSKNHFVLKEKSKLHLKISWHENLLSFIL